MRTGRSPGRAGPRKPGKFELADGGTIFLDELGEMPMDAQKFRSCACPERRGDPHRRQVELYGVGGASSPRRTRTLRKPCASTPSARIHTIGSTSSLVLPPLRSRMSDIELLAEHFLLKFAGSLGKDVRVSRPARWRCSGATSGPAKSVSLKT